MLQPQVFTPCWRAISLVGPRPWRNWLLSPLGRDFPFLARPVRHPPLAQLALSGRHHDDALVLGPAYAPCKGNIPDLAWLGLECPFQHAAPVAHIGCGRRRRRWQHLDL